MTGMVFGHLTVTEYYHSRNGKDYWICMCVCKSKKISGRAELLNGTATTCGCTKKPDFVGKRFTRLCVIEVVIRKGKNIHCLCRCDCGNIKLISKSGLIRGTPKCCGCLRFEISVAKLTTHGKSRTTEYRSWSHMKERCLNSKCHAYKHYGGRGISVCPEWVNDFSKFFLDMGKKPSDKHSIDRIDVNGNYCLENCRWATMAVQNKNRSNNTRHEYLGKIFVQEDLAKHLGTTSSNISHMLKIQNLEYTINYYLNKQNDNLAR